MCAVPILVLSGKWRILTSVAQIGQVHYVNKRLGLVKPIGSFQGEEYRWSRGLGKEEVKFHSWLKCSKVYESNMLKADFFRVSQLHFFSVPLT